MTRKDRNKVKFARIYKAIEKVKDLKGEFSARLAAKHANMDTLEIAALLRFIDPSRIQHQGKGVWICLPATKKNYSRLSIA